MLILKIRNKKGKQISEEIIEVNKHLINKERSRKDNKGARIANLRTKLDKVDHDLITAEQEYQKLLSENQRLNQEEEDLDDSDLNERVAFDDDSGHPNRIQKENHSNVSLQKLAQDISEIKTLIEDTGIGRVGIKDYLLNVEDFRKRAEERRDTSFDEDNTNHLREQIQKERTFVKREQRNIERQKKRWREEKILMEEHPQISSQEKREFLDREKEDLERQIDVINDKISDIKQKERILRKRELEESYDERYYQRDQL